MTEQEENFWDLYRRDPKFRTEVDRDDFPNMARVELGPTNREWSVISLVHLQTAVAMLTRSQESEE